jgi:hypothetical protein
MQHATQQDNIRSAWKNGKLLAERVRSGLLLVAAIDFARAGQSDEDVSDGRLNVSLASRLALRARCKAVELPQAFARRDANFMEANRKP